MAPLKSKLGPLLSTTFGAMVAVTYGAFSRIVLGNSSLNALFGTVSIGFLFLVPLAIGSLSVFFAAPNHRFSWLHAIFAPWIPCAVCLAIAGVFAWELWFCIVMAAPIFFAMATLGGLLACGLLHVTKGNSKPQMPVLLLILVAPYFSIPLENRFPQVDTIRTLQSDIVIKASPETVWRNITRFRPVSASELRPSLFRLAGLPRPLEATLNYDGVGGVRRGIWEDGLAFNGIITEWRANQYYSLRLFVDTDKVQPTNAPLGQIGGANFDMVDDSYGIEPLGDGSVRLRLSSTYRLTTRLNSVGSLWLDFFVHDIQNYILQIEKARCESAGA
jgi:hypothetical protein